MQIHFGIETVRAEWDASVVCVGTFDGVHLGHRRVILSAVESARKEEIPGIVVTFDRHPAVVLAPAQKPPSLASLEDNLAQFADIGAAVAVVLPFDERLVNTSAQDFIDRILLARLRAIRLVVGHDFALGKGREGDGKWLADRIPTTIEPPLEVCGLRVSSSIIREAVQQGRMEDAERLLGRPFALHGAVVHGAKLGQSLGFPTVNLVRSCDQVLPPNGVYGGRCQTVNGTFRAAVSIGVRPTLKGGLTKTIEAFLLDYPGDSLYGTDAVLAIRRRLRDEEKFDDLEALARQIEIDVRQVAEMS
jgi:riboflavin kinase/FMN adenylyltransferase